MMSSLAALVVRRGHVSPATAARSHHLSMNERRRRGAGALMIAGAVLVNIGFVLLGSRFNYPDVLEEPAQEILLRFQGDSLIIGTLFVGLAGASALLIPIAWLSRPIIATHRSRTRRLMVAAGIGAGIVQVVGLLRWPLLVPTWPTSWPTRQRVPPTRRTPSTPFRRSTPTSAAS